MGWKSTIDITRDDAEKLYFENKMKIEIASIGGRVAVSDSALEDLIEEQFNKLEDLGVSYNTNYYNIT